MINLFGGKRNFISIEIDEKYIKMAHTRVSDGKNEVMDFFVHDVSNAPEDSIANLIKDFVKKERIPSPNVVNIIPSNYAISKNIEIPSVDKKEIKDILDLQAGRHTPYSRDEIVLSYSDVGISHGRYTKILLVIVKKDIVTKRYDILKKGSLKANSAILSSEAVSKLCYKASPDRPKNKPIVVIHIDSINSDFTVLVNNKNLYLRSIPIGSIYLLSRPEESHKLFLDEIKKSLDSYQAENIEASPYKIYFAGAGEGVTNLIASEITKLTNIPADVLLYQKIFSMPQKALETLQKNKFVSPLSVIAASAIINEIDLDLVPEEVRIRKELKKRGKKITELGILFMSCLVIFCGIFVTNLFLKKAYLQKISVSFTKEEKEALSLTEISERTGTAKRFINQKGESLFVLTELFNAMPKEVFLSSIALNPDNSLVVTGTADSMSRVFSLVTDLENNKLFKNVKVDFTKTKRIKDQEVADFGLTFFLEGK